MMISSGIDQFQNSSSGSSHENHISMSLLDSGDPRINSDDGQTLPKTCFDKQRHLVETRDRPVH